MDDVLCAVNVGKLTDLVDCLSQVMFLPVGARSREEERSH